MTFALRLLLAGIASGLSVYKRLTLDFPLAAYWAVVAVYWVGCACLSA